MSASSGIRGVVRATVLALASTGASGCVAFGPPFGLPGADPMAAAHLSGITGARSPSLGPALNGRLASFGVPPRARGPAFRTDDVPLPAGRRTVEATASGLVAWNGALVGGLLHVYAAVPWAFEAPEPALAIMLFGGLGAANGAIVGSLGDDPSSLVWILCDTGLVDERVPAGSLSGRDPPWTAGHCRP